MPALLYYVSGNEPAMNVDYPARQTKSKINKLHPYEGLP